MARRVRAISQSVLTSTTGGIDELFLMYRDGRLIKHKTRELKPIDADILTSMLTAVQAFVKDAFKGAPMNVMGYGNQRIYLAQGTYLILAVVSDASAEVTGIHEKMQALIFEIEQLHNAEVAGWSGEVSTLAFVDSYLEKLLASS
jgi:hypothetical protein